MAPGVARPGSGGTLARWAACATRQLRPAVPIPADRADYLIATAARAPSVHNTQPWRFRVGEYAIELHADVRRKLRVDPLGRELLISCGAALFGLRLAVRSLGYLPVVELLPDPAQLRLLARVRLGAAAADDRQGAPDAGRAPPPAHPPRPLRSRPAARRACSRAPARRARRGRRARPDRPGHRLPEAGRHRGRGQPPPGCSTRWPGPRCGAGAGIWAIPPTTASPPTRSPPAPAAGRGSCRSVTSTWAAAWDCCPPAGRRPPPPPC